MRIIAFVNKDSGPAYHRVIMPLLLMNEPDVFITNNLLEEHFDKGCDIFMYNRILPPQHAEKIAELKKRIGFKTVVDVDDFWFLDEHHILYQEYIDIGFAAQQINHIRTADLVLTTHERLAGMVRPINPNVHVCPNAIPHQGQFEITREPYYLTRLFWQGSITHRQDIEILHKPLESLGPLSKKIKMIMVGYTDGESEWHSMAMTYTAKLKHQYRLIPGEPITSYYDHYKEADICLVPLVNSPFNRMKSNLKILEAANLGLPVIASNVHPYIGMPVLFCKHTSEWVKHITRLVASRKRQKEAGQELAEYCQEHYNFNKINKERKQILEYEAGK